MPTERTPTDGPPDASALLAGAARFLPTAVVTAHPLDEPLTWAGPHGSRLSAAAGDWLLRDAAGATWTVAPDTFARTYRRLSDGRYARHEPVRAARLTGPVEVETREGRVTARAGDWLLRDAAGAVWPVPDGQFRERYRPAPG